ncbi:MAG TPA: hypothetical protein VGE11_09245 [Pseudonocardia sp.]
MNEPATLSATLPTAPDALADAALRRVLAALSTDDLVAVATGRARLELCPVAPVQPDPAQLRLDGETTPARARRGPATPVPARAHGVDVDAVVARINELPTPAAVEEYLQEPRFTAPMLKQIARALGPTVPATGRTKAEIRRDIVAGTVGFRSRSAAMSGGAWS